MMRVSGTRSVVLSFLVLLLLAWPQEGTQVAAFSFSSPSSSSYRKQKLPLLKKNHKSVAQKKQCNDENIGSFSLATRREALAASVLALSSGLLTMTTASRPAQAAAAAMQDSLDVENFLRTGVDAGGNMGVSSQAGKSRPQTGVVFRDGTDVIQDSQSGAVTAEILTGTKANPSAVFVSFVSPWKLETGPVFDVETRDRKTGDGAFVAVTKSVGNKQLADLPDSFFLERLFDKTGRFSFYGSPTDIKVKKSAVINNNKKYMELSFSNLSQSTNAEIPRKAVLVATLPAGTDNAVMLVGSAAAGRWKTVQGTVRDTVESFRAEPAPKTNLKLRPKDRSNQIEF